MVTASAALHSRICRNWPDIVALLHPFCRSANAIRIQFSLSQTFCTKPEPVAQHSHKHTRTHTTVGGRTEFIAHRSCALRTRSAPAPETRYFHCRPRVSEWPQLFALSRPASVNKMLIRHYVRRFASTAARAAAADAVHQPFSAAVVCSPDNRTRCIQRLQRTPTLRLSTPDLNRTSAVLVPLCTDADGRLSVLYTLRSASLNAHSRQVSFAGGKRDPTDVSYVACALREAAEEIGLRADQIDVSSSTGGRKGTPLILCLCVVCMSMLSRSGAKASCCSRCGRPA